MNTIPSGTTHSRYNKQKRKTNYFKQSPSGDWYIWNQKWDVYTNTTNGLAPITAEPVLKPVIEKLKPLKKSSAKTSKRKPQIKIEDTKFDNVIPTLAEEVADLIPTPVLRQLLSHYKNADVVEVVINVKTTHVIQG